METDAPAELLDLSGEELDDDVFVTPMAHEQCSGGACGGSCCGTADCGRDPW
jgi:hypothetical protein